MRATRDRRRRAALLVTVELQRPNIERLISLGLLAPGQQAERMAVGKALVALLDRPIVKAAPPPSDSGKILAETLEAAIARRHAAEGGA